MGFQWIEPKRNIVMPAKLQQGDRLPTLNFKLIDGDEITLPRDMQSRYIALLFFRGAW